MKAGLSKYQIQLLKEGPHQLAQAWLLQAMHNDYKKMKGIKEPPSQESGYQTTMKDVDRQTDELLHSWKEPERRPHIVEEGVFGDEGWSIEITNPIVERGTSSTGTGMVTGSDASGLREDEGDKETTNS